MKRRGIRGSLLVEILVASVVLSVGLVTVLGLYIQINQAEAFWSRQEQAACFAEDEMELLRYWGSVEWSAENLADAADAKWMEKDGVRFERTTTLRLRPDLDPLGHLVEAEVRVRWLEKAQPYSIVLVTYFAVDMDIEGMR